MKNEDIALISRILAGDETAFVNLVEKYQKQVHALAWRKIGDFHIAEEITQDTFLKVYQKLSTLKDPNQFSGWLYVIATRQCLSWLRKKRIETEPLEGTDTEWVDESAYSRYVAEEHAKATVETQREVVKKLLAKLKESERTVMTLHYLGEMTVEEISRFLGVSTSAIKLRLHRARQRLKKEEPMIREALSNFKLSPNLTENIMQKVEHINPAAPSGSKPFIPWVMGASSIALIVLMLGMGSRNLAHFQRPYSLDAQSDMTVELIDVPIVLNLEAEPDVQNQFGEKSDDRGRGDGGGQESNQVLSDKGDYTQWGLPKEAKARLGKGSITGNIAYSPDGTRLAVASHIGVWIYDAQSYAELDFYKSHGSVGHWRSGEELRNLPKGHRGWPDSVSFSPDGKTLASGGDTIVLWDVATGQQKAVLTPLLNEAGVTNLSFSPDGKTLASSHRDGTIRLFNVATTEKEATLTGHKKVWGASFSPDGKTLATACDSELLIWNVTTRKIGKSIYIGLEVYDEEPGGGKIYKDPVVFSLCFSPDGKTLATGHRDTTVRLWDIETRAAKAIFKGHTDFVKSVCFAPDGKTLVSGSWDNTIRIWDVEKRKQKAVLKGHSGKIMSIAYSTDTNTIASRGWNELFLWNATTGEQKATFNGYVWRVNSVAYSPDGTVLASGSLDGMLRLWDTTTRKLKSTLVGYTDKVWCVNFSPNGKTLASGGDDNVIKLWDVDTEKVIKTLTGHTNREKHANYIRSVVFSADGQTLASASGLEVYLWDVTTGKHLSTFNGHIGEVWIVRFSPDGKTLASGSSDKSVRLWDIVTGKQKAILHEHSLPVQSLCFSPDGKTLASGAAYDGLRLWNVETGQTKAILTGHSSNVRSLSFSPDGSTLASGSGDKTVRLWDVATGHHKAIFIGHIGGVRSVSFSPDGSTLASGSHDGTILLWDLTSLTNTNQNPR